MSIAHYVKQIEHYIPQQPGSDVRHAAAQRFAELSFPNTKENAWKYTNLELIANIDFAVISTAPTPDTIAAARTLLPVLSIDTHRVVFVDGYFCAELSAIASLPWIQPFTPASRDFPSTEKIADGLDALNIALMNDGIVATIPAHTHVEQPIHMIYLYTDASADKMMHLHHRITLETGAQATFIEHHISQAPRYFSTAFTHAYVEEKAQLHYHRWQEHSLTAYHVSRLRLHQAHASQVNLFALDMGGHLVRNDMTHTFQGEDATCNAYGIYILQDKQHVDNHLTLRHATPHCYSRQFYKGILDGRAHGIFHGKVIVHADAQKTDADQHNANLLLSETAEIDTQPQLEIYADDVKCSHGATVGQLDNDALFYLQSRGLDYTTARDLLIYGFAAELLMHIKHDALRHFCQSRLLACLPKASVTLGEVTV